MQRNLSLDGLRGLAVFMVLLLHHNFLNAGWMGVDIFFVLSGFLITSILRNRRNQENYWSEFWIKRAARILPPLVLTIVLASVLGFHSSLLQFIGYLLSFADYLAYARPRYEVLQSLWSLAVEEHFYLAWPLAVRFLDRRSLTYTLLALLVIESALRGAVSIDHRAYSLVYYTTPFRLDGLALGSLMSIAFELGEVKALVARFSLWAGLLVAVAYISLRLFFGLQFTKDAHSSLLYNLAVYPLVSLGSAALLAYVLTHQTARLSKLLASPPLVFLGSISYGVYLYQVLIRQVVTHSLRITNRQAFLLDLSLTLLFAWCSLHFYEQPLIRLGRKRTEQQRKLVSS